MPEIPLEPVRGPSVWTAAEIAADDRWVHRFSDRELAEIDTALDTAQARGLTVGAFGREEFSLPTLAATIDAVVQEVEAGRGFALFRGLPVDDYDLDQLRLIYWGIGGYFGNPISQNSKGQILADVIDLGNDYSDINARGYKTSAALSAHVDSSDLVALLCVRTARSGGESTLVSSMTVFNEILARRPEYLEIFFRGFKHDLRGEGVTARLDEVTFHEIPVFSYFGGQLSCNFNAKIIRSARQKLGEPLSALEDAALDYFVELTRRPDFCYRMALRSGDIQLVNNYTVLHGRSAYTDYPEEARKRRLMRFWVNSRAGRNLAPDFANRYNTGPGQGVAVGDGARYLF